MLALELKHFSFRLFFSGQTFFKECCYTEENDIDLEAFMLSLMIVACITLELVTVVMFFKRRRDIARQFPALGQDPDATPFEKWRRSQHLLDLFSRYSQRPYQKLQAVARWLLLTAVFLGGSIASLVISDFVNWFAFIFPIGLLLAGIGLTSAQRQQAMGQLPAWQSLLAREPQAAADLGVSEASLPQLKQRIAKLMGLYWLRLLAIGFLVVALLIAMWRKY